MKLLTDEAANSDGLGRGPYASGLARVIAQCETPFVVGIYGEWGSGKTTLLKMVSQSLDSANVPVKWFDAWIHQHDEAPLLALLHAVCARDALSDKLRKALITISGALADSALRFTTALSINDVDELARRYDEERFAQRTERELLRAHTAEFLRSVRGEAERLVIIIDNLDRCEAANALALLEGVKLYLEHPGCIVVLSADRSELERAVATRFGANASSTRKYLDKIVQLPFSVPPIHVTWLDRFVRDRLSTELASCTDLLIFGLGQNPRAVKRFINVLTLSYELARAIESAPDPRVLSAILLVQYHAPDQYALVTQAPEYFGELVENAAENEVPALKQVLQMGPFDLTRVDAYVHLTDVTGVNSQISIEEDEETGTTESRGPNPAFMRAMTPSPELAVIVGPEPQPRTEVTKKVWAYIKDNNLQDSVERRMIVADDALRRIFKKDRVSMFEMTKLVNNHLR